MENTERTGFAAVIAAAGSSSRMCGIKKEYQALGRDRDGKPVTVLGAIVSAFAAFDRIENIVITVPDEPGAEDKSREAVSAGLLNGAIAGKRISFVSGGPARRASVHNALNFLRPGDPAYVLIHDGARPWVSLELIQRVMAAVAEYRAVIPVLPLTETPKELDASGLVTRHLKRAVLGIAQTPQAFAFRDILRAHELAEEKERGGREYTDDAEVWAEFIGPVMSVSGEKENRKITFPSDLPPCDAF